MISLIKTSTGRKLTRHDQLTTMLEILLKYREGRECFDEEELMALRLWALSKCCYLARGEELTVYGRAREPGGADKDRFVVRAGRSARDEVYVDDGEDVIKGRAEEFLSSFFGH
ncbi:hypothetical protein GC174_03700 [bacterium]|nr:hypothetical protein [bacterium]